LIVTQVVYDKNFLLDGENYNMGEKWRSRKRGLKTRKNKELAMLT
jgi:hypothetical protein